MAVVEHIIKSSTQEAETQRLWRLWGQPGPHGQSWALQGCIARPSPQKKGGERKEGMKGDRRGEKNEQKNSLLAEKIITAIKTSHLERKFSMCPPHNSKLTSPHPCTQLLLKPYIHIVQNTGDNFKSLDLFLFLFLSNWEDLKIRKVLAHSRVLLSSEVCSLPFHIATFYLMGRCLLFNSSFNSASNRTSFKDKGIWSIWRE